MTNKIAPKEKNTELKCAMPLMSDEAAVGDTITLCVPQKAGQCRQVSLIKFYTGYIGPRGEFYPSRRPTVDQLQKIYGNV